MNPHQASPAARHAGIAIIASALASIAAVALDSMASGKDALSVMQSMISLQQSHQLVHLVAMACLGGLMFGYSVLAQQLGLKRTPVLLGLVAYAMGSMLMLIATVIDGFIGTDLALLFVGKSPEAVKVGYWMIQAASNVVLVDMARVAWVCQSVAAVCWAIALLGEHGYRRAVGMLGVVVGALPGRPSSWWAPGSPTRWWWACFCCRESGTLRRPRYCCAARAPPRGTRRCRPWRPSRS